jgi:hypothetical protein
VLTSEFEKLVIVLYYSIKFFKSSLPPAKVPTTPNIETPLAILEPIKLLSP